MRKGIIKKLRPKNGTADSYLNEVTKLVGTMNLLGELKALVPLRRIKIEFLLDSAAAFVRSEKMMKNHPVFGLVPDVA